MKIAFTLNELRLGCFSSFLQWSNFTSRIPKIRNVLLKNKFAEVPAQLYVCFRKELLAEKLEHLLGDIAEKIKYGPHFPTLEKGDVHYLKGQHFTNDYLLGLVEDSFVDKSDAKVKRSLLRTGDVILAAKGTRHFVWAYRPDAGPCVASSLFYVIRVDEQLVVPNYFALYMNLPPRVRAMHGISRGASVPVIPKEELMNLSIQLPPLAEQHQLVRIYELQQQRRNLLRQLINLQQSVDDAVLQELTQ
ncbi:restriction endonuclease subunit S [Lewinella sp. IMCC34183]|uniref:restriction endonuclease subunit S n=1 Tax=Lewinella sp. IMCC34183 TaxID=2248762 RepID=UPI000E281D17|nr:restriction endonuclease subunit S [Lewinella sp. IMCC34183]